MEEFAFRYYALIITIIVMKYRNSAGRNLKIIHYDRMASMQIASFKEEQPFHFIAAIIAIIIIIRVRLG